MNDRIRASRFDVGAASGLTRAAFVGAAAMGLAGLGGTGATAQESSSNAQEGYLRLFPATAEENTVTPSSNFPALTLRAAPGQTTSRLEVLREDGLEKHLELRDATLAIKKLAADGTIAPEIHLLGQNGGALWGVDVASDTKSSDLAMGCLTRSGDRYAYNGDVFYVSNGRVAGGLREQASFGWPAPADHKAESGTARLQSASPADAGGKVLAGHDIAAFIARGALGQTSPVIASRRWSSASDLWAAFIDGSMEWRDSASGLVRRLGTDRKLSAYGLSTRTTLLAHSLASDTQDRFRVSAIGSLEWSSGTGEAYAADCVVRRYNPNVIVFDETAIRIQRNPGFAALALMASTDTHSRLQIQSSGTIKFGSGDAPVDTAYLARHAAGVLRYGDRKSVGMLTADGGIGIGNSVARTNLEAPNMVTKMIEVFDARGASIGAVPVYPLSSFS